MRKLFDVKEAQSRSVCQFKAVAIYPLLLVLCLTLAKASLQPDHD